MPKKILTIITINYNNLSGLKKTEESICSQINTNFEWIIIDGASTDGFLDYSKEIHLADLIVSEKDNGIYDAMHKGLTRSTNKYILFLNSGDEFHDERSTEEIIRAINNTETDVYFFSTMVFSKNISYIRKARDIKTSRHSVPAIQQSTVYKKEKLLLIDWPNKYKICGDFSISAQILARKFSSESIEKIVSNFYLGGVSTEKPIALAIEAAEIQRKYLSLNYLYVSYSFIRRVFTGYVTILLNKI